MWSFRLKLKAVVFLLAGILYAASGVEPVKYVFLFIGDGMSLPQRSLTEEYCRETGRPDPAMNKLAVQGTTTTFAANSFITDSAAAGTAIATGHKTNFGALGVDPDGKPLESVAAVARRNGRRVGIITTVSLDHATPAAFYAHTPSRGNYPLIAAQLLDSHYDFFGGGGFLADEKKGTPGILDTAKAKHFTTVTTRKQFDAVTPATPKPLLVVSPRLTDGQSMPYAIDARPGDQTLADITQKAIDCLDGESGFFLMVEGGKIDWACHANDAATAIHETSAFDDAIRAACRFAQKHSRDTLIIVTGDHETGGLTLGFGGTHYTSRIGLLAHQKISAAVFSQMVKEWKKNGNMTFDMAKPVITEKFGLKFSGRPDDPLVLTPEEQRQIEAAFLRSMGTVRKSGKKWETPYGKYNSLSVALTGILNHKAGIAWTSNAHTALPVVTSAEGKNAAVFSGRTDNTDLARQLKPMLEKLP